MSKNPIRKDKTCLNCNYVVENRYCPNCGQENTETRKTFHHLFVHFIEDLTHYENAFWKTIRNLIFRPGSLTKEYLSGKRMSYLAPFRLYIFISFVTFLIFAIIPDSEVFTPDKSDKGITTRSERRMKDSIRNTVMDSIRIIAARDSIKGIEKVALSDSDTLNINKTFGYKSVAELDSLQKYGPTEKRISERRYSIIRKIMVIMEHNTSKQIQQKFTESFVHNLPKVLFIYMPLFAFVLWVFQDKKRWYYFDHGIFTLHYFSFLLLACLTLGLIQTITGLIGDTVITGIVDVVSVVGIVCYMLYYFFPAHYRFYGESRATTIFKGIVMFIINSILAGIIMLAFIIYTFINIH